MNLHPLPRPVAGPRSPAGSGAFLLLLARELRAASASLPVTKPRIANDNEHLPAFA